MKYIFIIILSLVLSQPALAAQKINGSVPNVQPLQPVPSGIAPNVNHNVQEQSAASAEKSAAAAGTQTSAQPTTAPNDQSAPVVLPPTYKKSSAWVWWVLIIVGLLALGIFIKRKTGPQ